MLAQRVCRRDPLPRRLDRICGRGLKIIGKDPDYADERAALEEYADLLDNKDEVKANLKNAEEDLEAKIDAKYPNLTEEEVKTLVVDDKWLAYLAAGVRSELDRVSQNLTGRIRQLAERYETPLSQLDDEVIALSKRVEGHLRVMRSAWS
jgi:type I restriction enzyme M protein